MTGKRVPVTLCIVAMNAEVGLARCLDSVAFADEIVVVDSHSTDGTREVARERGARVIERDWPGFIEQKNFALDQATHDWVLCLDADECLSPELGRSIEEALARDDLPAGFEANRRNWYLGRWILHGGWYPERRLRLFRRSLGRWGGVNPHDHVYVEGAVERLHGDLLHYSYDSISDHLRTIDSFTTIAAAERHAAGKRAGWLYVLGRPVWKFLRMYFLKAGFLDGGAGLIVAILGSYYVFLKGAKLMELGRGWKPEGETRGGD